MCITRVRCKVNKTFLYYVNHASKSSLPLFYPWLHPRCLLSPPPVRINDIILRINSALRVGIHSQLLNYKYTGFLFRPVDCEKYISSPFQVELIFLPSIRASKSSLIDCNFFIAPSRKIDKGLRVVIYDACVTRNVGGIVDDVRRRITERWRR